MTTCPVCEHSQAQGETCEVCGKELAKPAEVPVQVEGLPELEATQLGDARAPVSVSPLTDLEGTRLPRAADLPVERVADLELTRASPAQGPAPERLADLELSREPPDEVRTQAPSGAVACRYCKIVQISGLLCDHCGMRLPRVAVPALAQKAAAPAEGGWAACSKCHTAARIGRACSVCGSQVRGEV